jgi:O-antigen ligase
MSARFQEHFEGEYLIVLIAAGLSAMLSFLLWIVVVFLQICAPSYKLGSVCPPKPGPFKKTHHHDRASVFD